MIHLSCAPRSLRAWVCFVSFSLSLLASARGGWAQITMPNMNPIVPAAMRIRVEEGLVTAQIQSTPLPQVLEELAARSGVVFEIQTQDSTPVWISFYRTPLEEAIQRIVGANNSIFYYGKDATGQSRVEFVRIFPRANVPQQPSLNYIGTGAVTKTGDDTVESPEQAVKVLTDGGNLEARQKSVEVLVAARTESAPAALQKALEDPAPEVRAAAIEGLATLGVRAALPQIVLALKDKHPGVRQSAITAVALMGDTENVKSLRPLAKDGDASVAAAAEMAIRKLSMRRP